MVHPKTRQTLEVPWPFQPFEIGVSGLVPPSSGPSAVHVGSPSDSRVSESGSPAASGNPAGSGSDLLGPPEPFVAKVGAPGAGWTLDSEFLPWMETESDDENAWAEGQGLSDLP